MTVTRGLGAVGVAWPAWAQRTWAPTWSRNPGIFSSYVEESVEGSIGISNPIYLKFLL
jgi:hypothetical protein